MMLTIDGRDKTGPIRLQVDVKNQFDVQGVWLKGNPHFHPHGASDLRGLCQAYRQLGFDFLASTDYHFMDRTALSQYADELITFCGMELSGTGRLHLLHLICIGDLNVPPEYGDRLDLIGQCIDSVEKQKGVVVVAHPYWSGLSAEILLELARAGVVGLEVSNRLCWSINGKERSDQLWHWLSDRNCHLAAVGCDDWTVDAQPDLLGRTWTGVLAQDRSAKAVLQAIREGRTYASEGPKICDIHFTEDGKIIAECSPCAACHFMSSGYGVRTVRVPQLAERFEVDLVEDGYRLKDWLCICVEDAEGRKAWSSAIKVSNTVTRLYE